MRAAVHTASDALSRTLDALEISSESRVDVRYLAGQIDRVHEEMKRLYAGVGVLALTDDEVIEDCVLDHPELVSADNDPLSDIFEKGGEG